MVRKQAGGEILRVPDAIVDPVLDRLHRRSRGPAPVLVREIKDAVVRATPPVTDPLMIKVTSIKVHMVVAPLTAPSWRWERDPP
jgi:hypothetical protein